jgi:S-adenosylmethionine:tRNA ribosyltransferase-isomerase
VLTSDFDFELPPELIAQSPADERDRSRLLVLRRRDGRIEHQNFQNLVDHLNPGDLLVLNNSKVIPARLRGIKIPTSGEIEILLLEENHTNDWWAMVRPGKRLRPQTRIAITDRSGVRGEIEATILEKNGEGHCRIRFSNTADIASHLETLGEIPLPPYISRSTPNENETGDRFRYQTVFARTPGSIAAPTAGLHFTNPLLDQIRERGVNIHHVTLHVGLGTFAPVKTEEIAAHPMHEERFDLSTETANAINDAKAAGKRVIAVGTTTVRVLESVAAANQGRLTASRSRTRIFIHPPFPFQVVDALVTNFHLPRSTLLMLASAFTAPNEMKGRNLLLEAYTEAIRQRYRFFSYGDAMLII